ncbi:dual specificity protein phosphatase CDC14A-like [Hetaerina americana]|uniref:dual specificity protein phosphatase CDC14A-like n=1 Tax=Hetaerina americana TaxID=62018 RepID=UPI003A7F3B61
MEGHLQVLLIVDEYQDAYNWKAVVRGSSRDGHPVHPGDVALLSEFMRGRLYFLTLRKSLRPKSTESDHFFTTDDDFKYLPFNSDFGPLCLSSLLRYCGLIKSKLCCSELRNKRIIHYTSLEGPEQRANAMFLVTAFAVLHLGQSPARAIANCCPRGAQVPPILPFRDASVHPRSKHIHLFDCLCALRVARARGLFDPADLDVSDCERLQVSRLDFSWVVPRRLLAFAGPRDEGPGHPPCAYVGYFLSEGVSTVVRLNRPEYDRRAFLRVGIRHHDLFFPDGTAPTRALAVAFLSLCEGAGALAVHCRAGLGRTGVLIASRLVSHYGMRPREAVAWVRICRPGSIMSCQQEWLEANEGFLAAAGHPRNHLQTAPESGPRRLSFRHPREGRGGGGGTLHHQSLRESGKYRERDPRHAQGSL